MTSLHVTSLPVTSLPVTSHQVAMLLSVMSNGTFCTTTIVRTKARGGTSDVYGPPISNIKVVYRDSSRHISVGAKRSGPLRMRYWKWKYPIKNISLRAKFFPTFGYVKGISWVLNWHKCLGGIMHLKPTAGHRHLCQLKTRAIPLT
jgi:hypothetical protein